MTKQQQFNPASDTDNTAFDVWSVASGFTAYKILIPLIKLDRYMNIAYFGCEDINEDLYMPPNQIAKNRYNGLKWSIKILRQILGSSSFIITKNDKTKYENYIKHIDLVNKYANSILKQNDNQITHEKEYEIFEELFTLCYEIIQRIKDEINSPLNNAGLIFRRSDEIDLDKLAKDISYGG